MAKRRGLKLEDIRNLTDPAELYTRLRHDPVSWSEEFDGWFLSRYGCAPVAAAENTNKTRLKKPIPTLMIPLLGQV